MEGGRVSAAAAADLDSYVDGELSAEELVVRVRTGCTPRGFRGRLSVTDRVLFFPADPVFA